MRSQFDKRCLILLYGRVAVALLAFIGTASVVLLQSGWLTLNVVPAAPERVGRPAASAPILKVTGQKGYFSDFIPVDPSKVYHLSGLFRASSGNVGWDAISRTYFGIRVYDKDRRAITSATGAYLYPAAKNAALTGLEGWVRLQGDITGVSEDKDNSFRPGTAWIRIVVVPNYNRTDGVTEVTEIEFTEKVDLPFTNQGDDPN